MYNIYDTYTFSIMCVLQMAMKERGRYRYRNYDTNYKGYHLPILITYKEAPAPLSNFFI